MIKKILFFIFLISSLYFVHTIGVYGECKYSDNGSLSEFMDDCRPDTLVNATDATLEGGLRDKIVGWIQTIAMLLGFGAVGSLVYAGMLFQFSGGQDEKITKAKDIVKWSVIGFLALISASGIIYVVIQVIFGLGS